MMENKILNDINYEEKMLKKRANKMILTDEEINLLKEFNFDYLKYASLDELLFEIDDYLNYQYDENLEYLFSKLNERNYYENIYK